MAPLFEAMLATFEAFRRLGFPADDIFAAWGERGPQPAMVLRSQGREFVVTFPLVHRDLPKTTDEFIEGWKAAANHWASNGMTAAQRRQLFDEHMPEEQFRALGVALVMKGFNVEIERAVN